MDGEDFRYFCEHDGVMPPVRENEEKQASFEGGDFPEVPDLTEFFKDRDEKS